MQMSTCKSCGARIAWVRTENGKNMPVDAEPERRVVVVVRAVGPDLPDEEVARVVDTFKSHFATCPNADRHRTKAKAGS